jgi:hypothetical protein
LLPPPAQDGNYLDRNTRRLTAELLTVSRDLSVMARASLRFDCE